MTQTERELTLISNSIDILKQQDPRDLADQAAELFETIAKFYEVALATLDGHKAEQNEIKAVASQLRQMP